ncbi:serine protease [Pseudomonas sp. v388]|uniref:S1 family peptidase n=1 Tax=Pseudomonas sp. v388 TaxID=2479849 RepID=UPI0013158081|nr:serine protease [Pseudomonas sp. v388]
MHELFQTFRATTPCLYPHHQFDANFNRWKPPTGKQWQCMRSIFFSPMRYDENRHALAAPETPGETRPFSVQQFLTYLEQTNIFPNAMQFIPQVKGVLDAMEREGILVAMGNGPFVAAPKFYYTMKFLSKREESGHAWLTPALGPDYLYWHFGPHTVHLIGDNDGQERGGTGWIISDRHVLTCAHVIGDMDVRPIQHVKGRDCAVRCTYQHPTIDVGVVEFEEPCLQSDTTIGFRDPVIGEQLFVLGYPPVPMSSEAPLILQGGEVVNESIADYQRRQVFLYSAIARPGNSGGPIVARTGHILGIVTEDRYDPERPQVQFFAGISTSTITRALSELPVDVELPLETYE